MAREHYVMRAHLDKFVTCRQQRLLFRYIKGSGLDRRSPHGIGPKGLGWANDFYAQFDTNGAITRRLDEFLQFTEGSFFRSGKGNVGVIARCIFDDNYFPSCELDRQEIAFCTMFSYARAPVQVHNIAMIGHLSRNVALFNELSPRKEETRKRAMQIHNYDEEQAREKIAEWQKQLLSGDLEVSVGEDKEREDGLQSLQLLEKFQDLTQMRWQLLEADKDGYFITSDNPVVVEDQADPKPKVQGLRKSRLVEVWFPISHRYGFLFDWRLDRPQGRALLGRSRTRRLNRRIVKWCYRHVYSPVKDVWLEEALQSVSFSPLFHRLTSLQDLMETAQKNIVDLFWVFEHGEKADVFENLRMH